MGKSSPYLLPSKITLENAHLVYDHVLLNVMEKRHKDLARIVLDDPKFLTWPGSVNKHHAYKGGLYVHTAQVLAFALDMLNQIEGAKESETACGIIWHDVAKTLDYEKIEAHPDPLVLGNTVPEQWVDGSHKDLIRHVSRSYAEFMIAAKDLPEEEKNFIGHIILSHHGRKEWGSPVEPITPEAWAVHAADMLSAHYTQSDNTNFMKWVEYGPKDWSSSL